MNYQNLPRFNAKTHDDVVGNIYQTKDYNKFHFDVMNRKVSNNEVNKLMKAIQNGGAKVQPIQVTPNFYIVDGQHRFSALRKLGLPIIYYIDRYSKGMDAAVQNSKQKHWKLSDYVGAYSRNGNHNYTSLLNMYSQYSDVATLSEIASLMTGKDDKNTAAIRNGEFLANDRNDAVAFLNFIRQLQAEQKITSRIEKTKMSAIHKWYRNENVNNERLKKILNKRFLESLPRNMALCMEYIGEEYNHGLSTNRINYYTTSKGQFVFER